MSNKQGLEVCTRCGRTCTPALYLQDGEKDESLCQDCSQKFLSSDEEWPPVKPETDKQEIKTPTSS